jgi:hypothetical protein
MQEDLPELLEKVQVQVLPVQELVLQDSLLAQVG